MNKHKKKSTAFTLVELIVVITILAILWAISFISLQDFNKDSRDSKRIADMSQFKKWIEIYATETWEYPMPDNHHSVIESWEILNYEWKAWDLTSKNARMSDPLTDPLTWELYDYAVSVKKDAYEIRKINESDLDTWFLKQVFADSDYKMKVEWEYNWLFVETVSGRLVAFPTLFWNLKDSDHDIQSNGSLLISNWDTEFTFTPTQIDNSSPTALISDLQSVYSSVPELSSNSKITKIVNLDTSNSEEVNKVYSDIFSWESEETDEESSEPNSCDSSTMPTDNGHITFVTGTPTSVNQAYVQDATDCWYSCTDWYTGVNCDVEPAIVTSNDCTSAWWMWVDSSNDVYIWTEKWNGFCISPRIWDFAISDSGGISLNWWGNFSHVSYNWWDSSSIDDSWNSYFYYGQTRRLDSKDWYTCKTIGSAADDFIWSDTIYWRMHWLATNKGNLTELRDIDWIQWATPPNGHSVPALYIADCIDWNKDLTTDMTYTHIDGNVDQITYSEYNLDWWSTEGALLTNTTYQNRQKYLTAWTQGSGSHLPSAFSYIENWYASASDDNWNNLIWNDRWEYQVACEAWLLTDSNDAIANKWIWTSAIGNTSWASWWRYWRLIGKNDCGSQYHYNSWSRSHIFAARFIVRP